MYDAFDQESIYREYSSTLCIGIAMVVFLNLVCKFLICLSAALKLCNVPFAIYILVPIILKIMVICKIFNL